MEKTKRILDSVHGYINIPEEYCDNIVDTPYFQRLRRVEQTSCRALFPSARHDRFIHSLGVFHLGKKIVEAIWKNGIEVSQPLYDRLSENYLIASLLHDVCHSPFSHTFEDFYDNTQNDLHKELARKVNNNLFTTDWESKEWNAAPHEIMSAIMAITAFPEYIKAPRFDCEFIARMIVGCKYSAASKSLENAFVELLHSDVLDADGLDYACRDAAMAGYSTNNIDVERLIAEIYIKRNPKQGNQYQVCFSNKAITEIESVLGVKHFQQYNVFAHHIVAYEQELLVAAMKSAASWHLYGRRSDDEAERDKALKTLCNYQMFYRTEVFGQRNIPIRYPSDDDFISLMKYDADEYYIKQWLSRQYSLQPLWKSKSEFKHLMGDVVGDTANIEDELWVFSSECKKFIAQRFNVKEDDVWIIKTKIKDRFGSSRKLHIFIDDEIKDYEEVYPKGRMNFGDIGDQFKFVFVPCELNKDEVIKKIAEEQAKHNEPEKTIPLLKRMRGWLCNTLCTIVKK